MQNLCDTNFYKHYYWVIDNRDTFFTTDLDLSKISKGNHFVKLQAFNINEFGQWYSDSIYNMPPPIARFGFNTTEGCQYVAFTITDSSFADSISAQGCSYHFYFGDGKDTILNSQFLIPNFNINHTYLQSGIYTVRLIFSNGYCFDTMERINTVFIKPAPAPKFSITTNRSCIPFTLHLQDTVKTYVKQKLYIFNDIQIITTENAQNFDTVFNITTDTVFKIKILLMSVTGCITTDSLTLHFKQGISMTDKPNVIYTTVINPNQTLTLWNKVPNAVSYNFTANGVSATITDTFFIDNTSTTKINSYTVTAVDVCNDKSSTSPLNNPMVLTAENVNNNTYSLLTYAPYNYWSGGVQQYVIQKQYPSTNSFIDLAYNNATQLTYNDNEFAVTRSNEDILQTRTCYRIAATNGTSISISNIACAYIKPTFFVPNAFSPNNDGINDYFKPFGLGITSYTLTLYNRWGELIYTGTEKDKGWDGKGNMEGIYVYFISAESKTTDKASSTFNAKGEVILVR